MIRSKKTPLLILFITAMVCSGAMFHFFNDPEGPNLLIVTVLATFVYLLSLVAYFKLSGSKRFLVAILVQVILVIGLYFLGN